MASQRLENLRRRQPDEKLEKLKERIRKQREHLEEAAERDKLLGYLEQPIRGALGSSSSGTVPTAKAKVRKVAPAPPAPVYRGTRTCPSSTDPSFTPPRHAVPSGCYG